MSELDTAIINVMEQLTTQLNASTETLVKSSRLIEQLETLVKKYRAALQEIEDYAQDKYDGPEDRHWGWVLARCQDARGR